MILAEQLYLFMSFSVPVSSWQDHSVELEKRGGSFVLRGLPENSFEAFAEKIKLLREEGVNAPIVIDPDAFDRYYIDAAPTLVLVKEDSFDKVAGNIPIPLALQKISEGTSP